MPIRRTSVVLVPPPWNNEPKYTSTEPLAITAPVARAGSTSEGSSSHRWLPTTTRVAPISSVKSVTAHMVLTSASNPIGNG